MQVPRYNGKVSKDSVVVPQESPRPRGPARLQVLVVGRKSLKILYRHSMIIITITMRVNRDEGAKELFDCES